MTSLLQRYSVAFWSAVRRLLRRWGRRVRASTWLADWVYPPEPVRDADAAYRDFNGWYFGLLDQQERMLADRPRMAFYHEAITRHIKPGARVIDLGTGTGILAAWAAQRGAAVVHALDHSAILAQAEELAAHNGIERVNFVAVHSSEFHLDEPVDVILHEQMGDYLFDEAMVANVCDLRDRLLKPGGLILPSRFEWYCEPVQLHESRRVPFIWQMPVRDYDYSCLRSQRPDEPEYYRLASCDLGLVERFLGEPVPTLTFDLHTVQEGDLGSEVLIRREVTQAGTLDGLVVYFGLKLDDDLSLSSSPCDPGRATHWGFRILRTDTEAVEAGDVIAIVLKVGRWSDPDSWEWTHAVERGAGAAAGGEGP